jgi:hypothetical protein
MIWWDQMVNNVLKNSFGDPYPFCKYDLLKNIYPSHLFHNVLYMDVIFIFTFYLLLSYLGSLTLIILFVQILQFFNLSLQRIQNNAYPFGIFKNILFLTWNFL